LCIEVELIKEVLVNLWYYFRTSLQGPGRPVFFLEHSSIVPQGNGRLFSYVDCKLLGWIMHSFTNLFALCKASVPAVSDNELPTQ